jgi:hypothetical protein
MVFVSSLVATLAFASWYGKLAYAAILYEGATIVSFNETTQRLQVLQNGRTWKDHLTWVHQHASSSLADRVQDNRVKHLFG